MTETDSFGVSEMSSDQSAGITRLVHGCPRVGIVSVPENVNEARHIPMVHDPS